MRVNKGLLYNSLKKLIRLIDQKASLPVLRTLRIEASDGQLRIMSTDLTTWLTTAIPCDGDFSACLPAKPLLEFAKPIDRHDRDTPIDLTMTDDGTALVSSPVASTTLETVPLADYPLHPSDTIPISEWGLEAIWDAMQAQDVLAWIVKAAGTDETRRHLMAVYFDQGDAVALNGHRLHLANLPTLASGSALVPSKAISTLLDVISGDGQVSVTRNKNLISFATGGWMVVTKLIDEHYPPFRQVIPKDEDFHCTVERKRLEAALKQLPRVPLSPPRFLKLCVNGQISIEQIEDHATASAIVSVVESTHHGHDLQIGVNGHYLANAIADSDDIITVRFLGELDPIVIESATRKAIIMPSRL